MPLLLLIDIRESRADPVKVVVLGATGMLGHMLVTVLEEHGHEVLGVSRLGNFGNVPLSLDLRDWDQLQRHLIHFHPNWVINAAGLLNEEVDSDIVSALLVNSLLPQRLAALGESIGFRTIAVGSDCVFEGTKGRYTVHDTPDAVSAYGRTKYLGELVNDRDLTIRTSIVGPEIDPKGRGLMLWLLSHPYEADGWTDAIWTGVTTLELSRFINAQVSGERDEHGLWHFVPSESISKFHLLENMNAVLLENRLTINQVPGVAHDRSLINDRPDLWHIPHYEAMLVDLDYWVTNHQDTYTSTAFQKPYGSVSRVSDSQNPLAQPDGAGN